MSKKPVSRREFIVRVSSVSAVVAAGGALSACGGDDDPVQAPQPPAPQARFDFGVASGDPLADRVILWTHARFADSDADVPLTYEVADDATFATLVASGPATASAATGFTAKADATGLAAGREYYFRFRAGPHVSGVGRTRTLPAGAVNEVKLAVFSCSNYPAGFFNVYAEGARSDAQFAIHLGDYIYEYGADGYASAGAQQLGRVSDPATEILTLADYRRRHAQYRSDIDLRNLHARMPMIAVWDDHELTNDAWKDGAENHTEGAEGSFAARRAFAQQAWHEWMPVRTGAVQGRTWRSFDFGNLVSLHMLDTRMAGRDRQVEFADLLNPATAAAARATMYSPTRQMLGTEQLAWVQQRIAGSGATWQVLGQQVLMARMEFPVSVLAGLNTSVAAGQQAVTDYLTARATPPAARTPQQQALMDPAQNPKIGYNLDAWDGYPLAREILLASVAATGKKLVTLAGDTHNAWHSDLTLTGYLDPAQADVKVGEEFATSSVTSPGLESYLPIPSAGVKTIFESVIDDLNWMDPARRGFLKMTFTPTAARGDWVFINTIASRTYAVDPPVAAESRSYT